MKHTLPRIAVALTAVAAMGAAAAADMKIGFVDVERISRESAPAERASKQLEKEFAPRQQELQRRETHIKELKGQLDREAMTMTETDRRAREQELARATVEYQRMQREFREDLTIRRNQEIQGLMERANRVIRKIAEAGKFDLIIQDAVYRDPRIDITDQVLKALAEAQ
ncbi:MAG TPA: OmpH family outer membrane protein [Burkholderiales bacterium]|nr:OmpH family outer membrane protein [Burkholderiales bacterium]